MMHLQTAVDLVATAAARLEESAYPNAVILPNFPRSIRSKDIRAVLSPSTPYSATTVIVALLCRSSRELHTTYEGTSDQQTSKVCSKRHGLKYRKIKRSE